MGATTTPSTISLLSKLREDFPTITFASGDIFHWSPDDRTVYYANTADTASLLHETAHAALGHTGYSYDIELLKMECDAWDYAIHTLAKTYSCPIDQAIAETMLDTYRDWLHSRSLCPNCEATGVQTAKNSYLCLACQGTWRVNEARSCALRRYTTHKK